jgi:hypothetical protein
MSHRFWVTPLDLSLIDSLLLNPAAANQKASR